MNQSSDYIDFILDKFSSLEAVTARKMFDDTFLFEPVPTIDKGFREEKSQR